MVYSFHNNEEFRLSFKGGSQDFVAAQVKGQAVRLVIDDIKKCQTQNY